jgi:hypothetical protein
MESRLYRPGIPAAVAVLAAAIAFLGYNLGSSQVANAANTASQVSSAAALPASTPSTPTTPLNLDTTGIVGGGFTELVEPTTAHIDLTSLTVAADEAQNGGGHIRVFFSILEAPTGTPPGDCTADSTGSSEIQQFDLQAGTTVTLSPASPIVMPPPSGKDECVIFSAVADTGASTGQVHVSATGFVASGTYTGPHGTG